jgi:hypothetical protein
LAQGPSQEAVESVHREAHGWVGYSIIQIDGRRIEEFLGRIHDPEPSEPWVSTAFRTIMFTDIVGSTSLTQCLGESRAIGVMRTHDEIVRRALDAHGAPRSTRPATASWCRSRRWCVRWNPRSRSSGGWRPTPTPPLIRSTSGGDSSPANGHRERSTLRGDASARRPGMCSGRRGQHLRVQRRARAQPREGPHVRGSWRDGAQGLR